MLHKFQGRFLRILKPWLILEMFFGVSQCLGHMLETTPRKKKLVFLYVISKFILLICWIWIYCNLNFGKKDPVTRVTSYIILVVNIVTALAVVTSNIANQKKYLELHNKMKAIEQNCRLTLKYWEMDKTTERFCYSILVSSLLFWGSTLVYSIQTCSNGNCTTFNFLSLITYFSGLFTCILSWFLRKYGRMLHYINFSLFGLYILLIRHTIILVNLNIKAILNQTSQIAFLNSWCLMSLNKIRQLILQGSDLLKLLMELYRFSLLITFTYLEISLFTSIYRFLQNDNSVEMVLYILSELWSLVLLCSICQMLLNECEKTKHELMDLSLICFNRKVSYHFFCGKHLWQQFFY